MTPIAFTWDGESMVPLKRFQAKCDRQFVVGCVYVMTEIEEQRSVQSHRLFFASVNEAWTNLPERFAERFPTADILRKWVLCRTNFCTMQNVACDNVREARRWATFLLREAQRRHEYIEVSVVGTAVVVLEPDSQTYKAMGRERFEASKTAVLDYLESVLDIERGELADYVRGSPASQSRKDVA